MKNDTNGKALKRLICTAMAGTTQGSNSRATGHDARNGHPLRRQRLALLSGIIHFRVSRHEKLQSQRQLSDGGNDELPWAGWFGQELFDEVLDEVFPVQDRLSVSGTDGIAPSKQVFSGGEIEPLHVALGR